MDPYKLRLVSRGKGYKEAMLPHLPKLWLWAPLTVELVLAADDDTPAVIASISEVALSVHTLDNDRIPLDDPMLIYKTSTVLSNTDKSKGPHATITLTQGDIMNITEPGEYWIAIHVTAGGERYVRAAGYITMVDDGFPVAPGEPTAPGNPYLTEGVAQGLFLALDQSPVQTALSGHEAEICTALGAARLAGATFTGGVAVPSLTVGGKTAATTTHSNGLPDTMALYGKWDQAATGTKGLPCYVSGANGTNKLLRMADAAAEGTSSKTIGLLLQELAQNAHGYVITEGDLLGITEPVSHPGLAVGVSVWLASGGGFVFGATPVHPVHAVFLGVVTRYSGGTFDMYVKVQNGYELNELHNVLITGADVKQTLFYDGAKWVNRKIEAADIVAPSGDTDKFLKGDGSWATVTSGGGATSLDGLSDVVITPSTLYTSQLLSHDGTTWVNTRSIGIEGDVALDAVGTISLSAATANTNTIVNTGETKTNTLVVDGSVITEAAAAFGGAAGACHLTLGPVETVRAVLGGYASGTPGTIYFGQNAYWDGDSWERTNNAVAQCSAFWMQSENFYWSGRATSGTFAIGTDDLNMSLRGDGTLRVKGNIYVGSATSNSALVATQAWVLDRGYTTNTGTVTTISVASANGVTGTVATATTTPVITLTLGAITPTSVNGITFSGSGSGSLAVSGAASISGTNTGDQTITLTGDVTGSGTGSFAATIASQAVTFAKMKDIAASSLIGRYDAVLTSGSPMEIGLGAGLEMDSTPAIALANSGVAQGTYYNATVVLNTKGQATSAISYTSPQKVTDLTTIETSSSTSITLSDSYSGKILVCTAATAVTITVAGSLANKFSMMVIQKGAGQVTFALGSGVTINRYGGSTLATAGQHAAVSLVRVDTDVYNLSGALA